MVHDNDVDDGDDVNDNYDNGVDGGDVGDKIPAWQQYALFTKRLRTWMLCQRFSF